LLTTAVNVTDWPAVRDGGSTTSDSITGLLGSDSDSDSIEVDSVVGVMVVASVVVGVILVGVVVASVVGPSLVGPSEVGEVLGSVAFVDEAEDCVLPLGPEEHPTSSRATSERGI